MINRQADSILAIAKNEDAAMTIASVVSLWRYPVKSMMGEEVDFAIIGAQGFIGDSVADSL